MDFGAQTVIWLKTKQPEAPMIKKFLLNEQRVRSIGGSFAFIEHKFLRNGFFKQLGHHGLLLYLL